MKDLKHRARLLRNHATDAERALWQHLRKRQLDGFRFRRQVAIAGYVADFACPQARVIIELDGGQHAAQQDYDAERTRRLAALGYRVLRYWNHDVLRDPAAVADDIHRQLTAGFAARAAGACTPPHPSPSPAAKGRESSDGSP